MNKLLCIKKVQREPNKAENFSKDKIYNIFDIDSDYNNEKSLQLEVLNNQNIPHIVACITGDIQNVKNKDWNNSVFFKEHFLFIEE